jgi:hypothetical protein
VSGLLLLTASMLSCAFEGRRRLNRDDRVLHHAAALSFTQSSPCCPSASGVTASSYSRHSLRVVVVEVVAISILVDQISFDERVAHCKMV